MTRYERVLAIAKQIDEAISAKSKPRADVTRFLAMLRGSKELPEHCEWCSNAQEQWHVRGKPAKLFEELEDVVNFHPTIVRMGVYDEEDEQEDFTTQEFQKTFDAAKLGTIQWQVDMSYDKEQWTGVDFELGWTLTHEGALLEKGSWDSRVEATWCDSSHSFSWENKEGWKPGKYAVALSLWNEPIGTIEFSIEGEAAAPKENKVAQITSDRKDRYARILELAAELEKKAPKTKALVGEIRALCEKRSLPEHVEWAEEHGLAGNAARVLERIEDLVNFHPKLARLGFFDGGGDPESSVGRPFEKRFDADKVRFITWQIEMDHPDEQYAEVEFELRWRFTQPNGTTDDEQVLASSIQETWSDSYHFVTCGDGTLEWPPGKYTLRVSLWDEPFAEATMFVDAPGGSI